MRVERLEHCDLQHNFSKTIQKYEFDQYYCGPAIGSRFWRVAMFEKAGEDFAAVIEIESKKAEFSWAKKSEPKPKTVKEY